MRADKKSARRRFGLETRVVLESAFVFLVLGERRRVVEEIERVHVEPTGQAEQDKRSDERVDCAEGIHDFEVCHLERKHGLESLCRNGILSRCPYSEGPQAGSVKVEIPRPTLERPTEYYLAGVAALGGARTAKGGTRRATREAKIGSVGGQLHFVRGAPPIDRTLGSENIWKGVAT